LHLDRAVGGDGDPPDRARQCSVANLVQAHAPELLQRPLEHVPPLQSEFVLQWPHVLFEHVPKPAQSEFVLHSGSASGASRIAAGESAAIVIERSAAIVGTATVVAAE
jgi:hypothetical protein